jgi:hypothetical protein
MPYLIDDGQSFRRVLFSNFSEDEIRKYHFRSMMGINWTAVSDALSKKFNLPQEACDNAIMGR